MKRTVTILGAILAFALTSFAQDTKPSTLCPDLVPHQAAR